MYAKEHPTRLLNLPCYFPFLAIITISHYLPSNILPNSKGSKRKIISQITAVSFRLTFVLMVDGNRNGKSLFLESGFTGSPTFKWYSSRCNNSIIYLPPGICTHACDRVFLSAPLLKINLLSFSVAHISSFPCVANWKELNSRRDDNIIRTHWNMNSLKIEKNVCFNVLLFVDIVF